MIEIFELPLFPLNTVLFPGMYLPLHIFEPRYKEMIRLCLDEKRPFGVVYIQDGQAEGGPLPEPHTVGCTAHIMQMQPLEDGRMNIMTIGRDRFRVLAVERERPYLVGQVERIPLQADGDLASLADRLYPQVLQYLQQLA
ncbi:MAG: LON peptidase substrate-binding domain-containing protein, partial [Anaerolineales bacterium]|nr:LON peptidase substrate-binding domain-containing protein [Anaerolineales bacterium]